jgi:DNA-binding LacI/PurR family transcriptional regulator
VPEDVGVIGMNDIPSAAYVFSGLTTVGFTHGDVLREMIEDIHSSVLSSTFVPKEYKASATLMQRKTV